MKVKIIKANNHEKLEEKINEFLASFTFQEDILDIVLDITFPTTLGDWYAVIRYHVTPALEK